MKKIIPFVLAVLFSVPAASAAIQEDVNAERAAPTSLSSSDLQKVQSTQFIFIDGIFGDFFRSNFAPAVDLVTHQWNASDAVVLRPSTSTPMSDNADILYHQISKIREASPNSSAIIVAHSKGATESLIMAMRYPDVITKLGVTTFALVSGPMQGTSVAQAVSTCSALNPLCGILDSLLPSLNGFLPQNIDPIFSLLLGNLGILGKREVLQHIYYVRTQMAGNDFTSPLFFTHAYLDRVGSSPNDGLIPTANEILLDSGENFGTDLGVMNGDHNSLLDSSLDSSTVAYRQSFFQVLMKSTLLQ